MLNNKTFEPQAGRSEPSPSAILLFIFEISRKAFKLEIKEHPNLKISKNSRKYNENQENF